MLVEMRKKKKEKWTTYHQLTTELFWRGEKGIRKGGIRNAWRKQKIQ